MSDLVAATAVIAEPEASALAECEAIIARGLETFVEVGNALQRIREERLYRREFGTFQEYCETRWEMTKTRAHQLIAAAAIVDNLSTMVDKPESERAVRPLAVLPPPQQREAWQSAVAAAGSKKPTARQVTIAVSKFLSGEPPREEGDSDEVCWARGLVYRAEDAAVQATYEDWSHFTVRQRHVTLARRAANAWKKLADYLEKLYDKQQKEAA